MADRKQIDWEAIEREYRAGQLSVVEIGRQHSISHTAINKRAKKSGWTRNLADRVRKAVSAKLVSEKVSSETENEVVELAAARGVKVVRDHQASIGRGQKLISTLFGELEEATDNRDEIEEAIEADTPLSSDAKRRAMMLRAVALPSRSAVIGNLSTALKTLVGLERQAFNLDAPDNPGNSPEDINRLSDEYLEAIASSGRPVQPTPA